MARPRRRSSGSLTERLIGAPHTFDFVQALRLIEAGEAPWPSHTGEMEQSAARAGGDARLRLRARFVGDARLGFPNATLTAVRPASAETGPEITVSGFGLIGPLGVLPYSYTALVADSLHNNNPALKAFIDIFQHRAVELFYAGASKYRIVINHDRKLRGHPDRFSDALASLTGLGLPALRARLLEPDETMLHFAGLFASKARTSAGLEALLAHVLDAPVEIVPLVGRWLPLEESEQTRIGAPRDEWRNARWALGQHGRLGASAIAGARTWSVQNSVRIVVGPIAADRIASLLPGGRDATRIAELASLYCGLEYEFGVNLIVRAASVPRSRLGPADSALAGETRLGQTSWILDGPSPVDRDDAVFTLDQA